MTAGRLSARRIHAALRTAQVARVVALDRVTSTNDEARSLADAGAPHGTLVVAAEQTAGRGRLGRGWVSPDGPGLYMSMLFRPSGPPPEWTRWTIGAAVAAAEACAETTGVEVAIRWPNDLYVGSRKLGGVLTEVRSRGLTIADLVVGIGINVGHRREDLPVELRGRATSLRACGVAPPPERERLAAACASRLAEVAASLERGAWLELAQRWEALTPTARNAAVRVEAPGLRPGSICRTAGLDRRGALCVRDESGAQFVVDQAGSVVPVEEGRCC